MGRPKAADYNDKRNALLDISAQRFARFGFDRTSISEIAEEAGVSKALVYHYYSSKDDLLFDIIHTHLVRLLAQIKAVKIEGLPPRQYLEELIRAILFAYRDADAMHKVQINELEKLPLAKQKIIRKLERDLVQILAQAIATLNPELAGDGANALLKPVTMSLFGVVNWSYLWFREDGALTREAYAQLVSHLFIQGLERFRAQPRLQEPVRLTPKLKSKNLPAMIRRAKTGT